MGNCSLEETEKRLACNKAIYKLWALRRGTKAQGVNVKKQLAVGSGQGKRKGDLTTLPEADREGAKEVKGKYAYAYDAKAAERVVERYGAIMPVKKKRRCLGCNKWFVSRGSGNRSCERCNKLNDTARVNTRTYGCGN